MTSTPTNRIAAIAVTALTITIAVTGCATSAPTKAPTPPPSSAAHRSGPATLKAPKTVGGDDALMLTINGGSAKAGAEATIYGFRDIDFGSTPVCQAELTYYETSAQTPVEIRGNGTDQEVEANLPESAGGRWWWILNVGDTTTKCGAYYTDVPNKTRITTDSDLTGTAGQPQKIALDSMGIAGTVNATIAALGPFDSSVAATALTDVSCKSKTPAWSTTVALTDVNTDVNTDVEFTPTKPGIYRVVVSSPATPTQTAQDPCLGEVSPTLLTIAE